MTEHENTIERKVKPPMQVLEIGPLGYGNEHSSISYDKQMKSGELTPEVATISVEIIKSREAMAFVTEKDDGCIDGRCTCAVTFFKDGVEQTTEVTDNGAHERYKVAGGGYATGSAMTIGTGEIQPTADEQLSYTVARLHAEGIFCGYHTGSHQDGTATDCGALDKFVGIDDDETKPKNILKQGIIHAESIAANLQALLEIGEFEFDRAIFDQVLSNWATVALDPDFIGESNGRSREAIIKDAISIVQARTHSNHPVAVSKRLKDDHKEDFIVVNYTDGMTFSQTLFTQLLKDKLVETGHEEIDDKNLAQVFVIDVPRILQLARAVARTEDDFKKAVYAGIMYQLATAATLTDGTLPVYVNKDDYDLAA